jgi:hypothetical protein
VHQAARERRERRLPPRRASEPARLSRGRPAPSWHGARDSRAISSGSRDLAPTCFAGRQLHPLVGRGLTAAARPPLSPPSLASVAAVASLASARQASCCCAALRPRHTRPHAGTPPSTRALLSAARPDGTPRRASRRRRQSFDCGGWAQQGVTIVLPPSYHTGAGLQGMPAARPRPCAGDRTS